MPNRAMVVQSSFWRVWLQGRLAPFPAPNRISITYLMVKKIEQGHTGAPGSLNFLTSICIYIYMYMYMYIYIYILFFSTKHICGKKSNPSFSYTRIFFTVLGLYFQSWGFFVPGGECRKLKHGGLCEKAEASAELPRAPVVDPKEPLTQVGMGDRKCWPLLGYVGVETPKKTTHFLDVICDFGGGKYTYTRILSK